MNDLVVHGTVNIALGNKNGLVVLTDSMVTSGGHQLPQPAQKLFRLDDETVCAQGDDFRTFLGDFVAALPQIEFPAGIELVAWS